MPDKSMTEDAGRKFDRDRLVLELLAKEKIEISDEAIAYFRDHPEEIDEVTASTRIHRLFLWAGLSVGVLAIGASRLIATFPLEKYLGAEGEGFLVEIVNEGGVALLGAALTAYFMGVLLNTQQRRAREFRKEIRRRL